MDLSDCYAISGIHCQDIGIQALVEDLNYETAQIRVTMKSALIADGYNAAQFHFDIILRMAMIRLNTKRIGDADWADELENCVLENLEGAILRFQGRACGDPSKNEITVETKEVATALVEDFTKMLSDVQKLRDQKGSLTPVV